ncbi:MAG TPA: ABC transporter transmembrane domain-containing protein [Chitinophagales bacterium]|nr:ABC transporter transmembrane domain-containing protein [Chitinophagales bacterium]
MKTYFRLLSFSKPYSGYLPEYIVLAFLSVVFGALNFSLIVPLLNVLFGTYQVQQEVLKPEFSFSASYFINLFNYFFQSVLNERGKIGALWYVCTVILCCITLANIFRYWSQRILARMRTSLIRNIRESVHNQFLAIQPGYFQRQKKGDLLSVLSNDVQEIENSVVTSIQVVFRDPATIIAYFILLFVISAQLTLFTLIFLPVSGIIISVISRRLKKESVNSQGLLGTIMSIAEETISGSKIIRAFNAEPMLKEKFTKENNRFRQSAKSILNTRELAAPLTETFSIAVVVGIMIYGGTLVLSEQSGLSASEFIAFIALYSQILPPAKNISSAVTSIQRGLAAGERVLRIIDEPVEIKEEPNALEIKSFNSNIEFKNVSFGYEDKRYALNNITATVPKGKVIALVGPSGSGKTTFADLLPRFYDPTEGAILIDGVDIRKYKLKDLRGLIGMVSQEPILFNDTVYNNLAFGMANVTEESVVNAAKVANAHDFISRMENGYQSMIGDRGGKLSGGEKQRLTIARAVLKNPPILILDEATSSLDTESERLVQDALYKLMQHRTSIVIAHRLSTIQKANKIFVLQKGTLEERGTHQELLAKNGIYKHLVDLQML